MKKILLLLLVSSLLMGCMAGLAIAGATLTIEKTSVEINPTSPVSVGLSVTADESASGYTVKLDPNAPGISAYISPDTGSQIPSIGSALSWLTYDSLSVAKTNTFTIDATQAGKSQTGKLWLGGNGAGNVKIYLYDTKTMTELDEDTVFASSTITTYIPEFPTVALPVGAMIAFLFLIVHKRVDL
jgi:hypothetical protein